MERTIKGYTAGNTLAFYFQYEEDKKVWDKFKGYNIELPEYKNNGDWEDIYVKLADIPNWQGTIARLHFILDQGKCDIQSIELLKEVQ